MEKGDCFGEAALFKSDSVRTCSVVALEEARCISIGRENLISILGDDVETIIFKNLLKWGLEKCVGIKDLTPG